MLFCKCGCLVAHEKYIFRKCFSVLTCLWCKMISVFILPSNTIFGKTEREREREREREEEKRAHCRRPTSFDFADDLETSRHKPRLPFDFTVWLWLRIAPRLHPLTSPVNPEARIACLWLRTLQLRRLRTPSTSLRWHRSHWVRDWEMVGFWWIWPDLMNFFWLGFDEFDRICVYLLRNCIIYLFGSWENVRNKKKMCFLYYFQQHNQTLENIFQSIFWNATKHLKIFSFLENSISRKYLFSGKYFTPTKHSLSWNWNFFTESIVDKAKK